jgi:uncharacterized protein YdbL (DUF1318 family)
MDWKTVTMILLTIVFVVLYVLGFVGWPKFAIDKDVVGQVGPIVAVIIGYYFGRLPAEANEQALQNQADQARGAQLQAQSDRDRLSAKVDATRAALSAAVPAAQPGQLVATLSGPVAPDAAAVRGAAVAALKVLDS